MNRGESSNRVLDEAPPAAGGPTAANLADAFGTSNAPNFAPDGKSAAQDSAAGRPAENAVPERPLQGCFDGFEGTTARGWARFADKPSERVSVSLYVNGKCVATKLADVFREDLAAARLGDGNHAFSFTMPFEFHDGKAYDVAIRTNGSAKPLTPGILVFQQFVRSTGAIVGIDGPNLIGWASWTHAAELQREIELLIDGKPAATVTATNGNQVALPIPSDFADGQPHVLTMRTIKPPLLIDETAAILPPFLTPLDVIRRHSASFLNAGMIPGAPARYESLRRQLTTITNDSSGLEADVRIERMRQVALAHEQVIHGFERRDRPFKSLPPLNFDVPMDPLVSVVIPIHDKVAVTYNCLASLLLSPNRASMEIIVVDDGSTDESVDLPDLVGGVRYLRNEAAQGYVHSCNAGARLARGSYVVMLNNDVEVLPGWIDEMLYVFEHFDAVGLVGAKLLYPNGRLQEAGGIVWNNGEPWNYGRGANASDPRFNYTRQVDYLSGACLLLPKNLWDDLGGYSEKFAPAYFEDTDLAFRVRERGLKTIYTPFSQVIHFEGQSNGVDPNGGTKRFQNVNRPKFKALWNRQFRDNGMPGRDVDVNKDRNVHRRALVVDYSTPQPDKDAGGYAAIQEMLLLQSLGFKVTFVPDNLAYLGSYSDDLRRMGIEVVFAPFVISVKALLEARGGEFDLVYITRYSLAQLHIDAIRLLAPRAKVLFNNADLHFLREIRAGIAKKSEEGLANALKTRAEELALMRKVDLVLAYNETERAIILSHLLDATRTAKCPWMVELPGTVGGYEGRSGIAFLGSFNHPPNPEAVEYFVKEIMPLLREHLPDVPLRIYGSGISEELRRLAAPDVIFVGWVAQVDEVYGSCRVFVAPLRSGAGVKGKVIGAIAHGVPSVLSPLAAEGLGIRDGLEAIIAVSPGQWCESIVRLYNDRAYWERMQGAARAYASTEFSFAKGQDLMRSALEAVDIYVTPDDRVLAYKSASRPSA